VIIDQKRRCVKASLQRRWLEAMKSVEPPGPASGHRCPVTGY
jgi:hypothetical protein